MNNNAETRQSAIQLVSGSLQDIQEIIEFLQWAFRKVDKGDTPEETVRMLLMNRAKIDKIKFDSNGVLPCVSNRALWRIEPYFDGISTAVTTYKVVDQNGTLQYMGDRSHDKRD